MIDLWRELSSEIEEKSEFVADFLTLQEINILNTLSLEVLKEFDAQTLVRRLIESASIFSDSSEDRHRSLAQQICADIAAIDIQEFLGVRDIVGIIQGKLHNFSHMRINNPTLKAPESAPIFLKFDFILERQRQSVTLRNSTVPIVLSDLQKQIWEGLHLGHSISISAPTSAGKSFILLLFMLQVLTSKDAINIVYLVPTRALINQVSDDLKQALMQHSMLDVVISSAPIDIANEAASKVVFVFTQERLDVFLNKEVLPEIELFIVDEVQMIGAGSRGVLLENVIDRLNSVRRPRQTVFAGPLLANTEYLPSLFSMKDCLLAKSVRSATIQNVIFVDYIENPKALFDISLLEESGKRRPVSSIEVPFALRTDTDKLSYLAALCGSNGSSLIYANGKADAEKISTKLCQAFEGKASVVLDDLIAFVKTHVHRQYALVETLPYGIGFHYGHMPALLRKELEDAFKQRKINFLVSTSTLLYGLNLPAKNIFLHKPSTGRGTKISSTDFWNLAGRAGRLGQELQGNVFLLDYEAWQNPVVSGQKSVDVRSATGSAFHERGSDFVAFLDQRNVPSGRDTQMEIIAGKLISDVRAGDLDMSLRRYSSPTNSDLVESIAERIKKISEVIGVSTRTLQQSISISPFRQEDLFQYFLKRIPEKGYDDMLPKNPMGEFGDVNRNLCLIFKRIHTYLLKKPGKDKSQFYFAPMAVLWMRGTSLPVLIDRTIKYNKEHRINKNVGTVIREVMEVIESDLRFRYVNLMTAYNNILKDSFLTLKLDHLVEKVENIPLYLELGASSGAMVNLMALGLSRISAQTLADYLIRKDEPFQASRDWLVSRQYQNFDISRAIIKEADATVAALVGVT